MNSRFPLTVFRLGGTSFLLAALCSFSPAGQSATTDIAAPGSPAIQPSDATPLSQFAERLGAGKPRANLPNDSAEAGMLREAFNRLAIADHDYDGHRVKAKNQVADAAKSLGVDLTGEGKGHEPQATSDEHLRAAQALLEQLVGSVAGPGLNHIKLAIEQISLALAVR